MAARAGMSRGAIYGNFTDKEALFLVVAASRWKPVLPPLSPAGTSFRQRMRALGEAVAAAAADDLPMPAEQLVKVIHALTEGLVSLHALTPNLITRAVIIAAFEALAWRTR